MKALCSRLSTAVAALALALPASAGVEIRSVRLSADSQRTRLAVQLSARTRPSVMTLTHPDRVVLDLRGARLARGAGRPSGAGVIKQLRMAHNGSGERIVLDLSRSMKPAAVLIEPDGIRGFRLTLDLADRTQSGAARNAAESPPPARFLAASPVEGPRVVAASPSTEQTPRPAQAEAPAEPVLEAPVKVRHAPPPARDLIIAVDAGHGGDDPGAIGKNGTEEKNVTLAIARALERQVNAEPGLRAVLTRDGDYFVPLRDRMRRARARQADLFVSIHADSVRDRSVDGSSVYILSQHGASTEAARWLAERENAADLIGGVSLENKGDMLASVLLDLSQTASLTASHSAAQSVLRQLNGIGAVRRPLVQQAGFMVLKSPDIPSMLIETAYISNPAEELHLRSAAHQLRLAAAIHQGLHDYFYADPPAGTRIAQIMQGAVRPALATAAGRGVESTPPNL